MIFIPKKEECASWTESDNGIYITYFYDGNETRRFPIEFFWGDTPSYQNGQVVYTRNFDPFYLQVRNCMFSRVLTCPVSMCASYPQLRYNGIIKKWYCNCPSSAVCTKNDDQDEVDSRLVNVEELLVEQGYCDTMIQAILKWNEGCGLEYAQIAQSNLKTFIEGEDAE